MNSTSSHPHRRWLLLAVLIAVTALFGAAELHAAAPVLLASPTTASISAGNNPDKSADFTFNQTMNTAAIDVTWQGTGIDPSKISYAWLAGLRLDCTYAGGWPPGVVVNWILNSGNSGVMKSAAGEALAQTSGNFTTPGTAGEVITITPSTNEVTVGETITFTFSGAMDTTVSAGTIFQPTAGNWSSSWQSSTVMRSTLNGGVADGATVPASYTLSGMKTPGGQTLADFARAITLHGAEPSGPSTPKLVSSPTTELISATQGKAYFVFSEDMNSNGIHITWSGTGIDPSKISAKWLVTTIGPVTLPVNTLEAKYQDGWPRNVDVSYVLNPTNSGVIKSALGVALPTTNGTFRTPASGLGTNPGSGVTNCPSAPAAGTDFGGSVSMTKEINYLQTGPTNLSFDAVRLATVRAAVIASPSNTPPQIATGATLNRPVGGSVALVKLTIDIPGGPEIPDLFFLSITSPPAIIFPTFASQAELDAAYPNGAYTMGVVLSGGGGTKTIDLPINPTPDPAPPMIANYDALQGFDATQPLLIQWNAFAGAATMDSIQLKLIERNGPTAYIAPNLCMGIQLNATDTSHTIPTNWIKSGVTYDLELTFNKTTHFHEADDNPLPLPNHIRQYSELGLLTKTTRLTIGAPLAASALEFTRVFVDQNGDVSLEVSGTLASPANFGIIQGSQNLTNWTDAGITITKTALDALGGKIVVVDPLFLTTPLPHRFYRIVTH